jgi:simple sugar transport system permease protein
VGLKRIAPGALALLLLVLAGGLRFDGFLSARVALDLLSDQAVLGVAALGATCVLVAGGLDLSIGSLAALASVLVAKLVTIAGWPPAGAIAAVLAAGAVLGALQGAAIAGLALPPFLVTLAGMFLFRGLALGLAEESIGIRTRGFADIPLGGGLELRAGGAIFLALLGVLVAMSSRSRFFARLESLGGDERAARLLGVPVARTQVQVYALSGACAALAGVVLALASAAGSSTACTGLELDAIAAAVVGGVALGPGAGVFTGRGRGHVAGAFLGVLVFGVLADLVLFEGTLSAGWTRVAMAAMLLVFLGVDRLLRRRSATA